jgi:hypothetical protein
MWQFIQDGYDFLVAQPLNAIVAGRHRQSPPRLKERHGAGAFAADVVQQRKVVLARTLKLLRNQSAHLPFRQQAGNQGARLAIVERLGLQGQRRGQGKNVLVRQSTGCVTKTQSAIDQRQRADTIGEEPDFQLMRHGRHRHV